LQIVEIAAAIAFAAATAGCARHYTTTRPGAESRPALVDGHHLAQCLSRFHGRDGDGSASKAARGASRWRRATCPLPPRGEARAIVCDAFGIQYFAEEGLITHSLQTAVIDRDGRLAATVEGKERRLGVSSSHY